MIYLATLFGFFGALFHTNPHPQFKDEEILDEDGKNIGRYLAPEIEKVLPKSMAGRGSCNMIGFERLKIILYLPANDFSEIEGDTLKAYHAAQKGLLSCKKLYNQTNDGPTSPNLIEIETITSSKFSTGVQNGKFFAGFGYNRMEWKKMQESTAAFQSIHALFQDIGYCKFTDYYTTMIEQDQPAVGLFVWVLVDQVPTLEQGLVIYKKKYEEMTKWAQVHYPGHFLMLKMTLKNEKTRFGVCYYNIRNHIAMFETIPTGIDYGITQPSYTQANYLDDLIPVHLQRPYYKK